LLERDLRRMAIAVVLISSLIVSLLALQNQLMYGLYPRVIPVVNQTVPFDEIDQGYFCGISVRIEYVIDNNVSWGNLWTDIHNISSELPDLPAVNFSSEVVIAVFIGEFPTGGYSATINRVEMNETGLVVYINEVHPGEGCGVTMAFSQPYHIVRVELTSTQPVDFIYNVIITNYP
jgi:hypothetical protein